MILIHVYSILKCDLEEQVLVMILHEKNSQNNMATYKNYS